MIIKLVALHAPRSTAARPINMCHYYHSVLLGSHLCTIIVEDDVNGRRTKVLVCVAEMQSQLYRLYRVCTTEKTECWYRLRLHHKRLSDFFRPFVPAVPAKFIS